ncbi:MAG: hypothetical protein IT425_09355 [Pirellulales bacterium]|nr:hypothetical protein [Pirellulales bacterium]
MRELPDEFALPCELPNDRNVPCDEPWADPILERSDGVASPLDRPENDSPLFDLKEDSPPLDRKVCDECEPEKLRPLELLVDR